MKGNEDVHCNLCQKSFSNSEFETHFSVKHFPKKYFACYECDAVFQFSNGLLDHLINSHSSINPPEDLKNYSPKKLFKDSKDVLRHTKESKVWLRYAFCHGFENRLNKKQLKSLVKDLYLVENDRTESAMCKFCDDTNGDSYCYFCGKHFSSFCSLKYHMLCSHLVLPNILKAVTPSCNTCSVVFQSEAVLEKHNHEKHNTEPKIGKTPPFCQYCSKSLANKSNLKRHILNQHSEQVGAAPINNVFTCHHCKSIFSNKSSVKRHIENLHLKDKDTRKSISCFQCEQKFNSIKNLNAHLTVEHHVVINEEKVQFSNLPEFWNWKKEEEIKTNSRFIQLRGLRRQRRKGEEISTLKFVCNRSGIFHSKSNGKRAYRIKGSSKIGRYCSSYIEIMFKENSLVDGIYCSTHSGHDNDLRYLALTMDEKREIYEKIKNGASFSTILNEIRNSVGKEIKRKHLVTNKDLHNIVTTFKKLSKPESEAADTNELSPTSFHEISITDESPDRPDRCFGNDLDICADLWVETCQRMINHSDQSRTSTIQDLGSKEDAPAKNHPSAMKNDFSKDIHSVQPSLFKPVPNFSDQFLGSNEFSSNTSLSTLAQPMSSEASLWSKQPHYTAYNGQELDPHLDAADSRSQYANDLPRSVAEEVHQDLQVFCSIPMIEDVQIHKDLYSSDPSVTLNNNNERVSSQEVITSSNCLNSFYGMVSSSSANSDMHCVQDVSSYDQSINSSIPSPENVFEATFIISETEDANYDDSRGPEKSKNEINEKNSRDDTRVTRQSKVENEKNEVSDLRDRVNSVTALFNIVESELDERKKNIIRNYVDNMFRVLQYRYNKCKTKKKQTVQHRKYQSVAQKRLNRRRRNTLNPPQRKYSVKRKPKQVNVPKVTNQPSFLPVSHFSAKSAEPFQNCFSNTILTDMRSDINVMRWDQY